MKRVLELGKTLVKESFLMENTIGTSQVVSEPRSGQLEGMKGKSTIRVKKIDYGPKVFWHLFRKF